MKRAPLALLSASLVMLAAGCAELALAVSDYLAHPLAVSSNAGLRVFKNADGGLVSFEPFQTGIGPNIVTAGGVLLFASLFLLAVLWRGRRVSERRAPTRSH